MSLLHRLAARADFVRIVLDAQLWQSNFWGNAPQEWPKTSQVLYPFDVRAPYRSVPVYCNPMVTEVDSRQDKVRIIIEEQTLRRRESQPVASGPVHPGIGLTAPHRLRDHEHIEELTQSEIYERLFQVSPVV